MDVDRRDLLVEGGAVEIRPIMPADAAALVSFHAGLSPETIHRRFFSPHQTLSAHDIEHFTVVDYRDRFAVVAMLGDAIVGVGRYERDRADTAEIAFVVADLHQGKGIGSLLLEQLIIAARLHDIHSFHADTLAENTAMLCVFRAAGFPLRTSLSAGVVHVEFPITEPGPAIS
jgi:GNAT superfamily N-acetyltransferase